MIALPPRSAKRRTEQTVLAETRIAINAIDGCRVFRNNCGEIHEPKRHLIYGLAPGSADLIGIAHGRFLSIETKHPESGRATAEQRRWAEVVRSLGGIALEDIRSAEQAVEQLRDALRDDAAPSPIVVREACPDCRSDCEPWTLDEKPCGLG